MASRVKSFIQYIVLLAITAFLVWFSLRGLQDVESGKASQSTGEFLLSAWRDADKGWLMRMAAVAVASHLLRAYRWALLNEPSGFKNKLSHSFYSLMVGYLVNLAVPRGGEVSRCYNLYKLDKTPVEVSFGTVVTERIIDLICLILLIAAAFLVESKKLLAFVKTLPIGQCDEGGKLNIVAYIIGGIVLLCVVGFLVVRSNKKLRAFFVKTFSGFKKGLLSVFKIREPGLFIAYSILIWMMYFVMSYTVIRAFPATENLGFEAMMSLFAIGAIAMAVPLPGGTGSYHVLVPQGLTFLYAVPYADAVAFTFIFHGWQTLIMIVGGALSLLLTAIIVKRRKHP